ncbi:CSEP0159 putative effector protein [Blumeria hordei DH14]|uniref:CSEP0159 putative effector protein n=1 Tax=Blumeria graminis f. sp. hordei (strain DH14) TaxID=546991 RepID=N1JAE4_BLUG1|nr:CSEP0159 putative effector protein [Blumeria hordei DH14]
MTTSRHTLQFNSTDALGLVMLMLGCFCLVGSSRGQEKNMPARATCDDNRWVREGGRGHTPVDQMTSHRPISSRDSEGRSAKRAMMGIRALADDNLPNLVSLAKPGLSVAVDFALATARSVEVACSTHVQIVGCLFALPACTSAGVGDAQSTLNMTLSVQVLPPRHNHQINRRGSPD